ncbi:MAG: isoprenylcysteine carboxyl methyltransferase family protein [Myxococcaceae bacterium]
MTTSAQLYLAFLLLVGVERLFELWVSHRNASRAFQAGAVEYGQGHFRAMSVLHTLFLFSCGAEVIALQRPFPGALGYLALAGAVSAQLLRYWAISTLGDRWNVRVIVLPDAQPVTTGPYRLVRHPNYVAVVVEILCIPLIHGAWVSAVVFTVLNAAVLFVRIRAEERALGLPYASAFEHRPRFVPSLRRRE